MKKNLPKSPQEEAEILRAKMEEEDRKKGHFSIFRVVTHSLGIRSGEIVVQKEKQEGEIVETVVYKAK